MVVSATTGAILSVQASPMAPTSSDSPTNLVATPSLCRARSASYNAAANRKPSRSPTPAIYSGALHTEGFAELLPLNMFVQERDGQVLSKGMVLKTDHFPENENLSRDLDVHVSEAPNFRQIRHEPIFGVGQPSQHSIRTILNLVQSHGKGRTARWICLREEPIVYLNNRPFVLRELSHPFRNLKYFAGIDYQRLEMIEARLKQDILNEAQLNCGNVLIHDEVSRQTVRPCWESCNESTVKTSREVFEELLKWGYRISYSRVPITPESVFDTKDIDHLVRVFNYSLSNDQQGVHIFSCQMGRGRSTLGTVVMRLLFMHFGYIQSECHDPSAIAMNGTHESPEAGYMAAYKRGDYPVIRRLLRVLGHGRSAKDQVDLAIDACGQVHNIRLAVLDARMNMETATDNNLVNILVRKTACQIQRYFLLICFGAYLDGLHPILQPIDGILPELTPSFSDWMAENPELSRLAEEIINEETISPFVPIVQDPAIDQDSLAQIVLNRQGSVLGKNMIIKSVYFVPGANQDQFFPVENAPNFRMLPGVPLAALGQPDVSGIQSVLNLAHRHDEGRDKLMWISLCSEPTLFIQQKPFVLRDYFKSFRLLKEFEVGLSAKRLSEIEQRLKDEVLAEIRSSPDEQILIHYESSHRTILPQWAGLHEPELCVLTSRQVFDSLAQELAPKFTLHYRHVPINAHAAPSPNALNTLLETIIEASELNAMVIFNCKMGRGRSSVALTISLLIEMHKGHLDLNVYTKSQEADHGPSTFPDSLRLGCKGILSLSRILKNGRQVLREVDQAIAACGKVHNLRNAIFDSRMQWETERAADAQSEVYLEKCVQNLERYAIIVCVNSYLHDRFKDKLPSGVHKFSDWLSSRGEISQWLEMVRREPSDAVSLPTILATDINSDVYENRTGSVLVPLSVLKGDYFPGSQRRDLQPIIDGAPNFRLIQPLRCVGTAVPTADGIRQVCQLVKNQYNDQIDIAWCNLREEPLLYINLFPFVLREVDNPYVNLEHTGITTRRVEAMERQLKRDVLEEAAKYGGKILLHDEAEDGNLISFWETISGPDDVLTCREMFSRTLLGEQMYHRIPITDEQAPLPETFDQIIQLLKGTPPADPRYCIAWNCQMGRGRTTTGMVICCLLSLHWPGSSVSLPAVVSGITLAKPNVADNAQDRALLSGQYKVIQSLVRVISRGVEVKTQTDQVIDLCSTMQNLRLAILDMKQRALSAISHSAKEANTKRARDYLIRYFYLIAFNAFLWELSASRSVADNHIDQRIDQTFQTWIDDRPEITNLLNDQIPLD